MRGGWSVVAAGVLLALAGAGCTEQDPGPAVPTLEVRSFEVPEIPTDSATLELEYFLPEPYLPGDDRALALVLVLTGPAGIASLGTPELEEAPDLLPQGEAGQGGAWYLPELGDLGPQDPLDGEHGRSVVFTLPFAAEDQGTVSAALQLFDVSRKDASDRGETLDDLQVLTLTFDGGDEEAVVGD